MPVQSADLAGSGDPHSVRVQKARIATAALEYLPAEGSVLIDTGSTTAKLVDVFPGDRDLTVHVNALPLAMALLTRPRLTVYTLGGRLRRTRFAEVGDGMRQLRHLNINIGAFLGTNGISMTRGLTTPDPDEAAVKRHMLDCAAKRVVLADHGKFGGVTGSKHADVRDVDVLITDTGLSDDWCERLRTAGVEVRRT